MIMEATGMDYETSNAILLQEGSVKKALEKIEGKKMTELWHNKIGSWLNWFIFAWQ